MKQFQMFELTFYGQEPSGSWAVIDFEAVFTWKNGTKTVKGFYAGDEMYKVRFLPEYTGSCVQGERTENCESANESGSGFRLKKEMDYRFYVRFCIALCHILYCGIPVLCVIMNFIEAQTGYLFSSENR